jgi:prevent-host-death family protein
MISIRPISDLRNHFTEVEKEVSGNDKPIIFTVNGKAAIVTISFEKYSKLAHLDYIERALDEADVYAESHNENMTHDEVFTRIKAKIYG